MVKNKEAKAGANSELIKPFPPGYINTVPARGFPAVGATPNPGFGVAGYGGAAIPWALPGNHHPSAGMHNPSNGHVGPVMPPTPNGHHQPMGLGLSPPNHPGHPYAAATPSPAVSPNAASGPAMVGQLPANIAANMGAYSAQQQLQMPGSPRFAQLNQQQLGAHAAHQPQQQQQQQAHLHPGHVPVAVFPGVAPGIVAPGVPQSRGTCAICHKEVMSDQERKKTTDGRYCHLDCFDLKVPPPPLPQKKSPESEAVATSPTSLLTVPSQRLSPSNAGHPQQLFPLGGQQQRQSRGTCAVCVQEVFNDQDRTRTPEGHYVHMVCFQKTTDDQSRGIHTDINAALFKGPPMAPRPASHPQLIGPEGGGLSPASSPAGQQHAFPPAGPASKGACFVCGNDVMTDQLRRKTHNGMYVHEACFSSEEQAQDYGKETHKQQQQQQQLVHSQNSATQSPHKPPELSLRTITLSPPTPPANRTAPVYIHTPRQPDDGLYGPLLTSPPRSPKLSPAAASALNPAPSRPVVLREEML
jgi:hypothetical protein